MYGTRAGHGPATTAAAPETASALHPTQRSPRRAGARRRAAHGVFRLNAGDRSERMTPSPNRSFPAQAKGTESLRRACRLPKALPANHIRVAHHDAGADAALLMPNRGIEIHQHHAAAPGTHSPSTHPSPGTQRTGFPADESTSACASSSGRLRAQSSKPSSANSAVSG